MQTLILTLFHAATLQEHTVDTAPANPGDLTSEIRIARIYHWYLAFMLLGGLSGLVWMVVDSCSALADQRLLTEEPLPLGLALSVLALGSSPAALPGIVPLRLGSALFALAVVAWYARELRKSFVTSVWFGEAGVRIRVGESRVEIPWTDVRRVGVDLWRGSVSSLIFETPHGNYRLPDGLERGLFEVLLFACRDRGLIDNDALPWYYRSGLQTDGGSPVPQGSADGASSEPPKSQVIEVAFAADSLATVGLLNHTSTDVPVTR